MLWLMIFQPLWANVLCSSGTPKQQYTLEILQDYFGTKNCEKTLKQLSRSTSISLVEKELMDISILNQAPKLEYLNLAGNKITDISSLSSLEYLKWLDLSRNPVNSMQGLPTQSLETFWCVNCQISTWETSAKMTALQNLSLRNNQLEDIDLSSFPQLKVLLLSNNQIVDPSILGQKKKIKVVDLHGNPIDKEKCPLTKDKKLSKGFR